MFQKKNYKKPTVLVILDGCGFSKEKKYNAVYHANTPNLDSFLKEYPYTIIDASGTAVGLPSGYIGNSEVGHLTIGAGRIIKQAIVKINEAISEGTLENNSTLRSDLKTLEKSGKSLHLVGLLSDAGVHSHINHLYALIDIATHYRIKHIYIHAILDGRDVPPKSAIMYLSQLESYIQKYPQVQIASISGRFYAMDRDKNWERTKQMYTMLTQEKRENYTDNWKQLIEKFYADNITDEYIPPTQLINVPIQSGDGIIFFNFRPDRMRQLTNSFAQPDFDSFSTEDIHPAFIITMTNYNKKNDQYIDVLFKQEKIENTLKDILEKHDKSIFSIAETEKYAHVTYFFSGGKEEKYKNETRVLIPSLPEKNYIDHPEMAAKEITETVLDSLQNDPKDFYLINYANPDMVGHSGDFQATVKAVEYVDTQLKELYNQIIEKMDGTLYITADHGNAEDMFEEHAQQPKTSHTTNPVYFIAINKKWKNKNIALPLHGLSDIAPFILKHMN